MSLTIIKSGIFDTIQDEGRFGFQGLGINPGGAMDVFSARLANCLLGKPMNSAVIEIHFPAPVISFNEVAFICLAGANFTCSILDQEIPLNQPVLINKDTVIEFKKVQCGARCYLSVLNRFTFPKWLDSYSTNIKAEAGGLHGAALKKGSVIPFEKLPALYSHIESKPWMVLPWRAQPKLFNEVNKIEVIKGSEWDWLDESSQEAFLSNSFKITKVADRMGYKLSAKGLQLKEQKQLVSTSVTFGTLQLLPSGQLIVLMADHQTTGGYPRVANVISAHLPVLAQYRADDTFKFDFADVEIAEHKLLLQFEYLQHVQTAAGFKMEKYLQ